MNCTNYRDHERMCPHRGAQQFKARLDDGCSVHWGCVDCIMELGDHLDTMFPIDAHGIAIPPPPESRKE